MAMVPVNVRPMARIAGLQPKQLVFGDSSSRVMQSTKLYWDEDTSTLTVAGTVDFGTQTISQSYYGGTTAGHAVVLGSTTHATKGLIKLGDSGTCVVVDEANVRLGVGCVPTNAVEFKLPYSYDSRSVTANLAIDSENFTNGKKYRIGKLFDYQGIDHMFNVYHDNGTFNIDDTARSGWSMYFASSTDHLTSSFTIRATAPGTNPRTLYDIFKVNGDGSTRVFPRWLEPGTVDVGLLVDATGSCAAGTTLIDAKYETVRKFSVDKDGVGYISDKLGICGTPTHPLDVVKDLPAAYLIGRVCNTNASGGARVISNSNTSTVNMTAWGSTSASSIFGASVASGSGVLQGDGTGTMCIGTLPNAEMRFGTYSTLAMIIDTSQNITLGGSKTLYGGSDNNGTLLFSSTSSSTKTNSKIAFGSLSTGLIYSETDAKVSLGTTTKTYDFNVIKSVGSGGDVGYYARNTDGTGRALAILTSATVGNSLQMAAYGSTFGGTIFGISKNNTLAVYSTGGAMCVGPGDANTLYLGTNGATRIVIDSAGWIDIQGNTFYGNSTSGGTLTLKGTKHTTPGAVNVSTRLGLQKSASVTADSTITVGDGNLVPITGTTTINYCTTTGWTSGSEIIMYFDGATTITHNAGSVPSNTAAFFFAAGSDVVTSANTVLRFVYDGTYWRNV